MSKFKNGQQGLYGAAEQTNMALDTAMLYLGHFNPPLAGQIQAYKDGENNIVNVPANQTKKTTGYEFKKKFANEEAADFAYAKMTEFKNSLAEQNARPTETSRQFSGYLKLAEKLMDVNSGDFGKAMAENPYLANMISMLKNGPKINEQKPIEQTIKYLQNTNPVTQKQETGPLQNLNIYMDQVATFLDREYEKQKINANYTPEKEQQYLKKLEADYSKFLDNITDLEKLVGEDGTSVYDEYLNGPLDVMTGKNKQNILSRPNIRNNIANIEGRRQAIRNGWGMNELGVLGSLNELKFYVDIQKARALDNANQPDAAPEAAQKYEQIKDFSKKLDAFHAEAMASALFHPSEKISFVDRYNELLESGGLIDDEIIKNRINQGKAATKEAMEFGGVRPVKYEYSNVVNMDRVVEGENAKHFNPLFSLNSALMIYMNIIDSINKENPQYFESINTKYQKDMDYEYRHQHPEIFYIDGYRMGPPIRTYLTDKGTEFQTTYSPDKNTAKKEKQASIDAIKKYHYLAGRRFLKDRDETAEMATFSTLPLKLADIEKGSILNAMIDNPLLISMYAHVVTFDPYNEQHGGAVMKQWMNERGLYDAAQNLIDSGNDFIEAEYEKQRLQLNGWNEKREKVYLAKVCEAIDKLEKNFDILKNAPEDAQYDESVLVNNSIAHLTGTDKSTTQRDMRGAVVAMQWVKEGIKKGWDSNDIQLLYYLGEVEGRVDKMIIRYKLRAEELANKKNPHPETAQELAEEEQRKNAEDELKAKIQYLDEFQKNQIKKFRDDFFKRPIQSPADKLAALSKIEGFYQRYKNAPLIGSGEGEIDAFAGIRSACDLFIPRLKNQCIEEIKKAKAEGRDLTVVKNREFTVVQNDQEMNTALQNLRNINFDFNAAVNEENREAAEQQKSQIKNITKMFLKKKLTNGMYKDAHPEYFKSSSPDYALTKRQTDYYLDQYVDHVMNVMKPANTNELAEVLEFGGHEDILVKTREKIKADAVRGRMEAFIAGKPERKKDDLSMKAAIQNMENATGWLTGDLYPGIVSDLKKLDKMRSTLSSELRKKYIASSVEVKITGYEKKYDPATGRMVDDPEKPLYDFKLPEEVSVDRRKLKEMTNLQADVYDRINRYLDGKKEIIRQRGGNPDAVGDAARLGTNGERRYRAMLDAKKVVENQNQATTEFNNFGPSMLDIQIINDRRIIPADVNLQNEKKRFENNIKYNMLKGTNGLQKKLAEVLNKELLKANSLKEDFDRIRTRKESFDAAKLAYERAEENLRNAQREYDRDLIESEDVGRAVLPEIKQRHTDATNAFNAAKTAYDNLRAVENYDSYRNFEQYKRNYEENLESTTKHCLYIMTILNYPFKGAAHKVINQSDELEKYISNAAKLDNERSELDEILGRFGGRMENGEGGLYSVSVPEAKLPAFTRYKEKHPEIQEKLRKFDVLQNRVIAEKERLGDLANPERLEETRQTLRQRKQEVLSSLKKMHEGIDKGYASKIAVDLMTTEDIRSKSALFEQMVNDIVSVGANGPEFNELSNSYAAFEEGIFEKEPYKEEFRKGIIQACAEQKPTAEIIRQKSDEILKADIRKNYTDENKMDNVRQMAIILDSDLNVRAEVNTLKQGVQGEIIRLQDAEAVNQANQANPVNPPQDGVNQANPPQNGANQANPPQNQAQNQGPHHAAGPAMH